MLRHNVALLSCIYFPQTGKAGARKERAGAEGTREEGERGRGGTAEEASGGAEGQTEGRGRERGPGSPPGSPGESTRRGEKKERGGGRGREEEEGGRGGEETERG